MKKVAPYKPIRPTSKGGTPIKPISPMPKKPMKPLMPIIEPNMPERSKIPERRSTPPVGAMSKPKMQVVLEKRKKFMTRKVK